MYQRPWALRFGMILALGLTTAGGCRQARTTVTLAGSTAFQPFAEKLAEQFMETHPTVAVTIQGGGSAVGIQSALSGAAQIGMADLVTLPPEAQALHSVTVARDGIALVVHPSNPVTNLTTAAVRAIFSGEVRHWLEVGGPDLPITVVSREAGSGTRTSFEQLLGGIRLTGEAIIQDSNGTVRETVANDPQAIGYLSHGLLNERIRDLAVDGVRCTADEIAAGRYPLVRPVFLLTRGPPAGAVREFLDYLLSAEGQATLRNNGLIPAR